MAGQVVLCAAARVVVVSRASGCRLHDATASGCPATAFACTLILLLLSVLHAWPAIHTCSRVNVGARICRQGLLFTSHLSSFWACSPQAGPTSHACACGERGDACNAHTHAVLHPMNAASHALQQFTCSCNLSIWRGSCMLYRIVLAGSSHTTHESSNSNAPRQTQHHPVWRITAKPTPRPCSPPMS